MPNYTVLSVRKATVHTNTHIKCWFVTSYIIETHCNSCIIPVCVIQVQYPFSNKCFLYDDKTLSQVPNIHLDEQTWVNIIIHQSRIVVLISYRFYLNKSVQCDAANQ